MSGGVRARGIGGGAGGVGTGTVRSVFIFLVERVPWNQSVANKSLRQL